jgi:hypothetical protein
MTLWIGVDEAGYGPNLGPLVVCASVWRTKASTGPSAKPEMWIDRLFPHVRRAADEATDAGIVVDDSKAVYQAGKGLAALERNVLALLELCDGPTCDADALRAWLDPQFGEHSAAEHWAAKPPLGLPTSVFDRLQASELDSIREAKKKAGIMIERFAGRVVFPSKFNQRLSDRDNKSAVLSETTIELVSSILAASTCESSAEEVVVLCDKHGGRDRYFAILSHFFPEERIEILREGEAESAYRWKCDYGKREIRFCAKAERFAPTAAASMMAKYVRELCMAEWNAFWLAKIPGLAPTAGYPLDAARFRKAIVGVADGLGILPDTYWRRK